MADIKYKDENGNWIEVSTGGGGGGSIEVDNEMSDTSNNAVANRVIKKYIDDRTPIEFSKIFSNDFTN